VLEIGTLGSRWRGLETNSEPTEQGRQSPTLQAEPTGHRASPRPYCQRRACFPGVWADLRVGRAVLASNSRSYDRRIGGRKRVYRK